MQMPARRGISNRPPHSAARDRGNFRPPKFARLALKQRASAFFLRDKFLNVAKYAEKKDTRVGLQIKLTSRDVAVSGYSTAEKISRTSGSPSEAV